MLNRLPLESDITPIFSTLRLLKAKESTYINVFSDLLTRTKSHRSKPEEKIFPAPVIQIEELKSTIENIQDDQIGLDTVFEIMKWTKVLEDKGRSDIRQSYAIETALPSLEDRIPSIQNDQTYLEAAARCVFWRLNSPEFMEQNIALLNKKLQSLLTSPNQYPWDIKTSWVISKVIKFTATTNQRTGSQSALDVLKKAWDFVEVLDAGEQGESESLRPHSKIKPRTYSTNGELYRVLLQLKNDGGLDDISKLEPRIAQAKAALIG